MSRTICREAGDEPNSRARANTVALTSDRQTRKLRMLHCASTHFSLGERCRVRMQFGGQLVTRQIGPGMRAQLPVIPTRVGPATAASPATARGYGSAKTHRRTLTGLEIAAHHRLLSSSLRRQFAFAIATAGVCPGPRCPRSSMASPSNRTVPRGPTQCAPSAERPRIQMPPSGTETARMKVCIRRSPSTADEGRSDGPSVGRIRSTPDILTHLLEPRRSVRNIR
jgi:hypothetical protein